MDLFCKLNTIDFPQIRPFVISIWCGEGKADLNEFLAPFVAEMDSLLATGILINNHLLQVNIKAIISDTPARSYLKGIMCIVNDKTEI